MLTTVTDFIQLDICRTSRYIVCAGSDPSDVVSVEDAQILHKFELSGFVLFPTRHFWCGVWLDFSVHNLFDEKVNTEKFSQFL